MVLVTANQEAVPAGWSAGLGIDEVLAAQGVDPRTPAARLPALVAAARRALIEGQPLLSPAVVRARLVVESRDPSGVVLTGGVVLRQPEVACTLLRAEEVVVAAGTIGSGIERAAGKLMGRDPVLAMALDAFGTAAVNLLAEAVCRDLQSEASRRAWGMTTALSPGQGEWDLEAGQRFVFDLVRPDTIGISLSERGQMRPCKSVSFIVGIGPGVEEREGGPCACCSSRSACHWRRHRGERGRE